MFSVQLTMSRIGNLTRLILTLVVVVVFFTLTDRASTIPSNIRGRQSGTVVVRSPLDRKISGEHLQSSNVQKRGKNDTKKKKKAKNNNNTEANARKYSITGRMQRRREPIKR